ncbi:hypothetical protein DF200_07775 [Bifidobacterium catulorum]|uniref:Uncharacterized protein n=1 Tax=Bifidobacterium catulorum TaxID=1630173 RepID=A0A2U2MRH9_9BIFI|nr:hypothetical protein DF200_07775 [Bifidobacterium catulorum]
MQRAVKTTLHLTHVDRGGRVFGDRICGGCVFGHVCGGRGVRACGGCACGGCACGGRARDNRVGNDVVQRLNHRVLGDDARRGHPYAFRRLARHPVDDRHKTAADIISVLVERLVPVFAVRKLLNDVHNFLLCHDVGRCRTRMRRGDCRG